MRLILQLPHRITRDLRHFFVFEVLKSARLINEDAVTRGKTAPLLIDEEAFTGIRSWLDKMTDPDYGRVGYLQRGTGPARPAALVDRFPADKSESMTAVGVLARIFMGEDPKKSDMIKKGAELCVKRLPTWNPADGSIDRYYWYTRPSRSTRSAATPGRSGTTP